MVKSQSNRTMQRSRASLIVLIVLAFLLMVGTGILVSRLPEDESWQWASQDASDVQSRLTGFACDAAEAQLLYPYLDGFIRLTPERVTYLDILGSERFAIDIDFAAPYATRNGRWMMVADREGTGYLMLTENGQAYSGRLIGQIGGVAVSKDGMAALLQDRQDSTGIVTILEAESGRHLFDCHFPQSGYVLSMAFTPDGSSFDVNLVNTDGAEPYPILKRYAVTGEQLGQRLPDLSALHPLLLHDPQGHPVLCGYSSIAALSYARDSLLWQQTYARIHAVTADEQGVWVLAQKSNHERVGLYRIGRDGQQEQLAEAGDSAVGPAVSGQTVAIGSGSRVLLIDSRTGALLLEENLPADIVRLDFSGPNSLLIVTSSGVSRLPFEP